MNITILISALSILFAVQNVGASNTFQEDNSMDPIYQSLKQPNYFKNNRELVEKFARKELDNLIIYYNKQPYELYFLIQVDKNNRNDMNYDPRVADKAEFFLHHMENNGAGLLAVCYFKKKCEDKKYFNIKFVLKN